MSDILALVRRAIETSGTTRYRIAQELNMDQGQLSRFMRGQGRLSVGRLEQLVNHLGYQLTLEPKPALEPKRKRGRKHGEHHE
jgi:hypothetical protein